MKSPWDIAGRNQDDMEALQTDVMRFMAVLGLCLAAIFSLVKRPDFNPPATTAQAPEVVPAPSPEAVAEPAVEVAAPVSVEKSATTASSPKLEPSDDTASPGQEEGFTLEFSSAASFRSLVDTGVVTLVVSDGSAYWTLAPEQTLMETPDLPGYYAMAAPTVPDAMRQVVRAQLGREPEIWGVVLPGTITAQIDDLVARHNGGVLLISAQGTVSYD